MRAMMQRLKLTVNEKKTHVCRLPEETFDFLGYTFGRCYSSRTGRAYIGTLPARKKIRRLCESLGALTGRRTLWLEPVELVGRLNCRLVGWANYFRLGPVSRAYRAVDSYVMNRLRQWLCEKHKLPGRGLTRFPDEYLTQKLGLVRLPKRTRNLPWANA